MKAFVLLVTWFVYGQPPVSYQTVFDTREACAAAQRAVFADQQRMLNEVKAAVAEAAKRGQYLPGTATAPSVSAICIPKG